jgi:hypothetical protein
LNALAELVRERATALQPDELLARRVDTLLGVSAEARRSLSAGLGIDTVFDLAASRSLGAVRRALASRADLLPADLFVATAVVAGDLGASPLSALRALTAAEVEPLAAATGARSLSELVHWAPYVAAQRILRAAYEPESAVGFDDQTPPDLLPLAGVLPQERRTLQRLLIDSASIAPDGGATAIETEGAVDLASVQDGRLTHVATGALLGFSQSWFTQGVALGQLLHSLSLAPGESTRMAMVDWSRRVRGSSNEALSESERLDQTLTQSRAVSEVTQATATEVQSGSASVQAESTTSQGGSSLGLEIGPVAFGSSGGSSSTKTQSMTATSTTGSRDVAASTAQQINQATQQHASAARSRRASVVREVSQSEQETLTTRVLTNYNHMHTLNLQYYEVVQAYRVTTRLERAERCIFVPLRPLDFSDEATIERWRSVLLRVARSPAVALQLQRFGTVLVKSVYTPTRLWSAFARAERIARSDALVQTIAASAKDGSSAEGMAAAVSKAADQIAGPAESTSAEANLRPDWRFDDVDRRQLSRLVALGARLWLRSGQAAISMPQDALLTGITWPTDLATAPRLLRGDGSAVEMGTPDSFGVRLAAPESLRALASLALRPRLPTEVSFTVTLQLSLEGTLQTLSLPVRLAAASRFLSGLTVVEFDDPDDDGKLIAHLQANAMHYSQAVFGALDDAAIASLLGGHSMAGVPLAQFVDHQPVAVFANCLVFKANLPNTGDAPDAALRPLTQAWQAFLAERGLDGPAPRSELVSLPTGGVFAEAVLGRSNAAERLDMTRFWNWQDSPIPITASEIGPLTAGSRADDVDLQAAGFAAPIVSQQAPNALPDPTGLVAAITALQSAQMFRDMSGLAQAAAAAQAAQGVTTDGAISAGQQAADTLKTVMTQNTERLRIAAEVAAAVAGGPAIAAAGAAGGGGAGGASGSSAGSSGSPSLTEQGGQLGLAKAIDQAKQTNPGAPPSEAEALLRQQTGVAGQQAVNAVVAAAVPPSGATGGSGGSGSGLPRLASKRAQSVEAVITIQPSALFSDPAAFINAPVRLNISLREPDSTKLFEVSRPANQGPFFSRVRTTFDRIDVQFFYEIETNWFRPAVLITNANLSVPMDGRDKRVAAFVKIDRRTQDIGPGDQMPDAAQLGGLLAAHGVDTERVLRLPTLSRNADGRRIAEFDFLGAVALQNIG